MPNYNDAMAEMKRLKEMQAGMSGETRMMSEGELGMNPNSGARAPRNPGKRAEVKNRNRAETKARMRGGMQNKLGMGLGALGTVLMLKQLLGQEGGTDVEPRVNIPGDMADPREEELERMEAMVRGAPQAPMPQVGGPLVGEGSAQELEGLLGLDRDRVGQASVPVPRTLRQMYAERGIY